MRVAAISLNRGETRRAMEAADGWCPGWDLAGWSRRPLPMVQAHALGRVVGFLRSGAWAESVVVPTNALAALPDAVTFAQAATLPVAGLTALYALTKRGLLLHRRVCITGATGGVGDFAIQLAHLAGARSSRRYAVPIRWPWSSRLALMTWSSGRTQPPLPSTPRTIWCWNQLKCLAAALATLAKDGVCVSLGNSASRSHLRYQTVSPNRSDDAVWLYPV